MSPVSSIVKQCQSNPLFGLFCNSARTVKESKRHKWTRQVLIWERILPPIICSLLRLLTSDQSELGLLLLPQLYLFVRLLATYTYTY